MIELVKQLSQMHLHTRPMGKGSATLREFFWSAVQEQRQQKIRTQSFWFLIFYFFWGGGVGISFTFFAY